MASNAIAELARRRKRAGFDTSSLCFPAQRRAVEDPARERCWVTTRRAGKTTGECIELLATAMAMPNVSLLYLNTTLKRAIDTVWDELNRLNALYQLDGIPNGSRFFLRMPNGSKVHVGGCETKKEADGHRGVYPRLALVALDEAQDWKDDLLRYTYASVIFPSLADIGGRFLMSGTPGPPRGFFYEYHQSPDVSFSKWSLFENPHVKDARATLERTMRTRGVGEDDPSIRREFFGEFAVDEQRQAILVGERALIDAAPTLQHHAIGVDFGTVDACAVVVWGWRDDDPRLYLVESDKRHGLGASEQVAMAREFIERYRPTLDGVVGDPGGGGAGLIRDLRRVFNVYEIEAAEKANKVPAILLMRDAIRSGTIQIPRAAKEFIAALESLEWHPDHVGEKLRGHADDLADAALYGFRKARHYLHEAPPPPPSEDEAVEARKRALAERIRARAEGEWESGGGHSDDALSWVLDPLE